MKRAEIIILTFISLFTIYLWLHVPKKPVQQVVPIIPVEVPVIKEKLPETPIIIEEIPLYAEEERELLARVIMSEGSLLPPHGKIAIMATIMNRVRSEKFPNTITEVIYQENQYNTAYNGDPTDECYQAIDDYVDTGWPIDMFYFRTDHPHPFGKEYCHIGNTYFSTED